MRIRIPDCHFDVEPVPPDPTFHFDADPDPSFQRKAHILEKALKGTVQRDGSGKKLDSLRSSN
jgi:hypothetical protein